MEQEMHTGVITDANLTPVCTVPEVQPPHARLRVFMCVCLGIKWLVSGNFHQAKGSYSVHLVRRAGV